MLPFECLFRRRIGLVLGCACLADHVVGRWKGKKKKGKKGKEEGKGDKLGGELVSLFGFEK